MIISYDTQSVQADCLTCGAHLREYTRENLDKMITEHKESEHGTHNKRAYTLNDMEHAFKSGFWDGYNTSSTESGMLPQEAWKDYKDLFLNLPTKPHTTNPHRAR